MIYPEVFNRLKDHLKLEDSGNTMGNSFIKGAVIYSTKWTDLYLIEGKLHLPTQSVITETKLLSFFFTGKDHSGNSRFSYVFCTEEFLLMTSLDLIDCFAANLLT